MLQAEQSSVTNDELSSHVEPVATLDPDTEREMFSLYVRYYGGTCPKLFHADLAGKDYVIVLRDAHGRVQGFSTLAVSEHRFESLPLRVLYSGDTVVEHHYWGQQTLSFAWIRLTGAIKAQAPSVPLYWFLIVKGHRTYRYLRAFYRRFYPTHECETPRREKALMDMLAGQRFGDAYHPAEGLVRFPSSHGHLLPPWSGVPEKDRQKPDVVFFLERNPGYREGHELVCLAEIAQENQKPLVQRLFCDGMKDGL